MKEKEFCLLEEPWIRVLRQDCTVEEVSLVDALVRAHTFRALAGELPTQDAAMLRMLLAVLYAVFARTREAGGAEPLADADDALRQLADALGGRALPGTAHPRLSRGLSGAVLPVSPGAAVLAGEGGGGRHLF